MLRNLFMSLLASVSLFGAVDAGGDPDLTLTLGSGAAVSGTVDIPVTFDNASGNVAAWSYGVCHTSEVDVVSVALGATSATVNGGDPPDFENTVVYPGEGWTTGLVISFLATFALPIGSGYDLNVATYALQGSPGDIASLTFCGDDFPLPVATIISVEGGTSVIPTTVPGTIEIWDQTFHFAVADTSAAYDPATGAGSFQVCPTIREDSGNTGYPNDALAFSMSVSNDDGIVVPTSVDAAGVVAGLDGGTGPDFFGTNIFSDSVTIGCVFAFEMNMPLQFTTAQQVACIDYDTVPGTLIGDTDGAETTIGFAASGSPEVTNTVVVGLTEIGTVGTPGTISLLAGGGLFIRGDGNGDGLINVADPVYNLGYQFQGGPAECLSALDCNDDGLVNIADPVYNLAFQFQGGPACPPPTGACGTDPTSDALTCDSSGACP